MGVRLRNERGAVPASRLPITNPKAGFASDGIHASEAGYRLGGASAGFRAGPR